MDGAGASGSVLTLSGCSVGSVFCGMTLLLCFETVGLVGGDATIFPRSGKAAMLVCSLGRDVP